MFWNKGSIDINGGPNFYSAFEHMKVGTQWFHHSGSAVSAHGFEKKESIQ